jgi:hypothetical protein
MPPAIRNAVVASDGDHETVIVRLERVPLAAVDIGYDVFRDGFRREVRGLDDLREGLAFKDKTGDVAHDVHEGIFCGFELHVAVEAVALACGKSELTRETRTFDATGPDEGLSFDNLPTLEQHLAGLRADDGRIEHDIAAALLQVFFRLGAQGLLENGQNRGQRLDVEDAHFLRVEKVLAAHHVAVVEQLPDHLDAGETCACDHEGEQLFASFGVSLEGGFVEFRFDMPANFRGIL